MSPRESPFGYVSAGTHRARDLTVDVSIEASGVNQGRVIDEFSVHDLLSYYVEDSHAAGREQRNAAMTWTVRAVRSRCCVEALTEAVAAAAWRMDPQITGADGECRLTLLVQERDELGGQTRIDIAHQWPH